MPVHPRHRAVPLDVSASGGLRVRPGSVWDGRVGIVATSVIVGIIVALLVGWVLAWVDHDRGPNALWITLGSVAFTMVLLFVGVAVSRVRANAALRHAEAAFLTGASHNLRTPLSAIRTASQTLKAAKRLDDDERALLLDAILHETARLELRVDNLLETARLDLERRPFAHVRIDVAELVRAVLDDARWAFAAAGGAVDAASLAEGGVVFGDRRALRLLVENLVDNALKYADGPPRVRVAVTVEPAGDEVVLTLRDAGVCFRPEQAGDLFRRFHRGDTGRPGSGLGLALAQAIARGHGGGLRITSPGPGRGASVELRLPLAASTEGGRGA